MVARVARCHLWLYWTRGEQLFDNFRVNYLPEPALGLGSSELGSLEIPLDWAHRARICAHVSPVCFGMFWELSCSGLRGDLWPSGAL